MPFEMFLTAISGSLPCGMCGFSSTGLSFGWQAVQLVQKERQAEEEASVQRAVSQAELSDPVAAALAGRPQRRLWEDIYTISYSRYGLVVSKQIYVRQVHIHTFALAS